MSAPSLTPLAAPFSPASVARQLDYCTFCPKMCRHACPVSTATGRETLIPQAKMDRLNQIRRGNAPWTASSVEPIWACTGCRQCTAYCNHNNEPGLVLLAGRAEANARGVGHPNLAGYPDRFRGREQRLVAQLRDSVAAEKLAVRGTIGYWPGCDAVGKGLDDVSAALDLFERIGAAVDVVDGGLACAGYPLLAAGYVDMFRWHAGKVARVLKEFRTVIINCSACTYALRALYPAEGVLISTEILALAEFLSRMADAIPTARQKKVVYYHDPCYLARYSGVLEEPRRVLARVAEVREFGWSHSDTECCGGGGLLPKTMPEVADTMARKRLHEVVKGGGGTVVTSCATCAFLLKRNASSGVSVRDLPSAVIEALDRGAD
ncbi:MAG: (Fe-S)-binding protein [Proteobacteria bacterium]|nr:(Fe-S)-binding protein [Pseudomonadota bacterium]